MKKRLKNGEFRYHCVVTIGDKQIWKVGGSNRKEAQQLLTEMVAELNKGTFIKPKKMLFRMFAEEWLQNYAFGRVKESTLRSYRGIIYNHIIPKLGHYEMLQVTPKIVQEFITSLLREGSNKKKNTEPESRKTVNNVLAMLKTMFKCSCEAEYTRINPAFNIRPYKVEKNVGGILHPHEIRLLIEHCKEPFRTILLTAVSTGMRRGEVFGLQWGDIDWQHDVIYVQRALYWLTQKEMDETKAAQRWRFTPPKTALSRRVISLTPILKGALQKHRDDSIKNEYDLIFVNSLRKPMDPENFIQREFKKALKSSGVKKIRFHDFRHTFASILIHIQTNMKLVQAQLGHASIQTTSDTYGHLYPVNHQGLGEKIDNFIFGSNDSLTKQAQIPDRTKKDDDENCAVALT